MKALSAFYLLVNLTSSLFFFLTHIYIHIHKSETTLMQDTVTVHKITDTNASEPPPSITSRQAECHAVQK